MQDLDDSWTEPTPRELLERAISRARTVRRALERAIDPAALSALVEHVPDDSRAIVAMVGSLAQQALAPAVADEIVAIDLALAILEREAAHAS